jgi:hypothetical protein
MKRKRMKESQHLLLSPLKPPIYSDTDRPEKVGKTIEHYDREFRLRIYFE